LGQHATAAADKKLTGAPPPTLWSRRRALLCLHGPETLHIHIICQM